MLPEARVVHALPGRLRVRIQSRRGQPGYFAAVSEWLESCPHVRHHEIQPVTGGILLHNNAAFDADEFAASARDAGMFDLSPLPPRQVADVADPLADLLHSRHVGHAVLGLLLAMSVVQISRGQIMAPATSMLWYAFDLAAGTGRR